MFPEHTFRQQCHACGRMSATSATSASYFELSWHCPFCGARLGRIILVQRISAMSKDTPFEWIYLPQHRFKARWSTQALFVLCPSLFEEYAAYLIEKRIEWTENGYSRIRIEFMSWNSLAQWLFSTCLRLMTYVSKAAWMWTWPHQ